MSTLLSLLLILLLLPGCSKQQELNPDAANLSDSDLTTETEWPGFRGDSSLHGYINITLDFDFAVSWKFNFNQVIITTPIIVNNSMYVSSNDGTVFAFDLLTRQLIWEFTVDDSFEASPIFSNDFCTLVPYLECFINCRQVQVN